jgi:3-dehydroquinate synthase
METIQIHTTSKEYPVILGAEAVTALAPFLKEHLSNVTKIMIITDSNVGDRYLNQVKHQLGEYEVVTHLVPNGEKAKTFDVFYDCLTAALQEKLDRKSLFIALGGGAIGDLCGFVAASFMRGVPFIQLPTTILAHDSAVGGKVAINHPLGKNMIGAFYQPEAVIYDVDFLQSLPAMERRSGFAEVMKHALIDDLHFYQWLLTDIDNLQTITTEQLQECLSKGIKVKESVVSKDEKELGIRAFLNFGHTLGHAIEAEAGYGSITHGEAVVIGMVFALRLSKKLLHLQFEQQEFLEWLHKLGYSTKVPSGLYEEKLIDRMKQDKKTIGQVIQFVLLEEVGKPVLYKIDENVLLEELKQFMKEESR